MTTATASPAPANFGLSPRATTSTDAGDRYYWTPGGSSYLTSRGFVCSSCQDPHAGGKIPGDLTWTLPGAAGTHCTFDDAVAYNSRLLRTSTLGKTVDDVIFRMATVGTFTCEGVGSGVYRVTGYVYGSTMWCGACHDRFQVDEPDEVKWIPGAGSHGEVDASWCVGCHPDTAGDHDTAGSGHAGGHLGFHRHPVNVPHVALAGEADVSVETGTPLEHPRNAEGPYGGCGMCHPGRTDTAPTGDTVGNLSCLTCHRAHSSIASAAGWAASWPRDAADPATGDAQGTTSALLRMDNRGLCYNCHGAGQYNCWSDVRFVACAECHG